MPKKYKIAIDTVCYQLTNNHDLIKVWETLFNSLPSNKDNHHYEITLLKRTQSNGNTYQFNPALKLEQKFQIKQIPDFNYMCMNQDVDVLNYICKLEKFNIFMSTSFTYVNVIPNVLFINDMKTEPHQPLRPIMIQKEKAILNASAFFYNNNNNNNNKHIDLLHLLYPHITKNNIPIQSTDISFDTYLTSLEKMLLQPQPFINIIIQSYTETNRERYKEFVYCFKQNIKNPYVKMIYDFGAGIQEADIQEAEAELYIKKYKKVDNPDNTWLTFEMAINYANTETENTSNYWCIMNLDIFLDDKSSWNTIRGQLNNGFIYAQSRHEFNLSEGTNQMDANFANLYHANTQDAWIFKTPLECNNKNIDFNFEIGFLGCDNAIADRLYKSGYKVINQPITYKIFHYDIVKGKNSSNYLEKHLKETKEMTTKLIKPKNKYPERKGCYLVPNYDQMLTNGKNIDLNGFINQFGGCSNWELYVFITRLFNDRIIINNP